MEGTLDIIVFRIRATNIKCSGPLYKFTWTFQMYSVSRSSGVSTSRSQRASFWRWGFINDSCAKTIYPLWKFVLVIQIWITSWTKFLLQTQNVWAKVLVWIQHSYLWDGWFERPRVGWKKENRRTAHRLEITICVKNMFENRTPSTQVKSRVQ